MMHEYITEMSRYLPIDCEDTENIEYLKYLKNAFIENVGNEKFQFALMAFHLMFMSYIYKQFWCMKAYDYEKVKRFCENNRQLSEIMNVYDMSVLSEKSSIEYTMKALGYHVNRCSDVQNFVDIRDKCAHASGFIQYKEREVRIHFQNVLEYTRQMSIKTMNKVQDIFLFLVKEYWSSPKYEMSLSAEEADKIVKNIKLSPAEIEYIFQIDIISVIGRETNISNIISYYVILMYLQGKYAEQQIPYKLNKTNDSLIFELSQILNGLDINSFEMISIELEDEFNALESYSFAYSYDAFKEHCFHLFLNLEKSRR